MAMPQTPESFVKPLPDLDTQEITLYGSKYSEVKLQEYRIDHVIDELRRDNLAIMAELDIGLAEDIMEVRPDIARSTDDMRRWVSRIGDETVAQSIIDTAELLRTHERNRLAIEWLETRKTQVKLAARLIGAAEHCASTERNDTDTWRASALANSKKTPISFAAIRGDL